MDHLYSAHFIDGLKKDKLSALVIIVFLFLFNYVHNATFKMQQRYVHAYTSNIRPKENTGTFTMKTCNETISFDDFRNVRNVDIYDVY